MQLLQNLSLETILAESNLVPKMNAEDVKNVGERILQDYRADDDSRSEWKERYATSLKLAQQYADRKSFPWDGASNVKFPLLTTAALQYHARAYPALVKGTHPVSCRVIGDDPDGQKTQRATRVGNHMSYQVLEEDAGWESDFDKALIIQSIVGSAFRKHYHDGVNKHNVSELVLPTKLVINYWAKSLETATRVTHVLEMQHNAIEERVRRGLFVELEDVDEDGESRSTFNRNSIVDSTADEIDGNRPPSPGADTPRSILEHHFWIDLDGDGYREPYIGFVDEATGQLLRLVARFENDRIEWSEDGKVLRITPEQYFTQMTFIPAPDGSVYGLGFGSLLGHTNEVVNTLINQLIDSGTMSSLGGGFLARGVKIRGGEYTFKPQEWKRTDSSSEDLKNGIYPLPTKEPSSVLFQLLNLMIEWGSKIGMATDALTGENPGQNQKVGTTQAVIQQGEKVFNGIYKRTYRALKHEFRLLYRLNYLNPPANGKYKYSDGQGKGGEATYADYFDTDKSIVPSADPTVASPEANLQRWMTVLQLAGGMPGFDKYLINRQILEVLEIPMADQILPKPGSQGAPQAPVPPQLQIQQMKSQDKARDLQAKMMDHKEKLAESKRMNDAKILELKSMAAYYAAQANLADVQKFGELINQDIQSIEQQNQHLDMLLGHTNDAISNAQQGGGNAGGNDAGPMGGVASAGGDQAVSGQPQGGGA